MDATNLTKTNFQEHIKKYGDLDSATQQLIQSAICARQFAYCPYSNFKVGAAFRTSNGRIFTGCNVENAAFSATSCAERTALVKAISEGHSEFVAGAVVAFQDKVLTPPCGVCRQFIMEFAEKNIPLFITKAEDNVAKQNHDPVLCTSIFSLLPRGFKSFK